MPQEEEGILPEVRLLFRVRVMPCKAGFVGDRMEIQTAVDGDRGGLRDLRLCVAHIQPAVTSEKSRQAAS